MARTARPTRRYKVQWAGWLWLFAVLQVLLGLWLSPVTQLRKVRIEGARPDQEARLRTLIEEIRKIPAWQHDSQRLIEKILADESILKARWQQNLFGRAVLSLQLREPVARGPRGTNLALDARGELYLDPAADQKLPEVVLPIDATKPSLSLVGEWDGRQVAGLAVELATKVPVLAWKIVLDSENKVSLRAEGVDAPVLLGTTDRYKEKVDQLRKALERRPALLQEVAALNLSAPEQPVIVPRGGPENPKR